MWTSIGRDKGINLRLFTSSFSQITANNQKNTPRPKSSSSFISQMWVWCDLCIIETVCWRTQSLGRLWLSFMTVGRRTARWDFKKTVPLRQLIGTLTHSTPWANVAPGVTDRVPLTGTSEGMGTSSSHEWHLSGRAGGGQSRVRLSRATASIPETYVWLS